MQKSDAVAAMGPSTLLLPAWIKAALAANDRLKLYMTVLQAAVSHAEAPGTAPLDLNREIAALGKDGAWLRDLPAASSRVHGAFLVPELRRLAQRLAEDLSVMARPLLAADAKGDDRYVDPDTWLSTAPLHEGSWWPAWQAWLAQHAGKRVAPPTMGTEAAGLPALDDAPGLYVHAA